MLVPPVVANSFNPPCRVLFAINGWKYDNDIKLYGITRHFNSSNNNSNNQNEGKKPNDLKINRCTDSSNLVIRRHWRRANLSEIAFLLRAACFNGVCVIFEINCTDHKFDIHIK